MALVLTGACMAPPAQVAAPSDVPASATADRLPSLDPVEFRLVERVADGDTLTLAGGERVRILGIDTPELKHPDPAVRDLAQAARRELQAATEGERVRVIAARTGDERDRFGRLLAYIEVADTPADIGERLIVAGLARPYPSAHPRAARYRELAREARAAGRGMWAAEPARILGLLPEADIACSQAAAHEGRRVRVRGRLDAQARAERVHRLSLRCADGALEIIVFPSRYDEIPLELIEAWRKAEIAITGKISLYKGKPQIVLEDPFQVD